MAKKTNKTHKLRGSREHGRGMKKGRGAGLRGGKGQSGWKHKKLHFLLYDTDRIRGKHGFTRHAQDTEPEPSVTVQHVDERAEAWAAQGQAAKQDDGFAIDLGKLGYEKLVGTGQVTRKLALTVGRASAGAVEKVQAKGGSVTQTNPPEPEPAPAAKPPKGPGAGGAPGGAPPARPPKEAKPKGAKPDEAKPKEAKPTAPKGGAPPGERRKQQG